MGRVPFVLFVLFVDKPSSTSPRRRLQFSSHPNVSRETAISR